MDGLSLVVVIFGVASVILILGTCLLLWFQTRRFRCWQDLARVLGVKKLHELSDGEYQRGRFMGRVGQEHVYHIYEVVDPNVYNKIVLLIPEDEYLPVFFTVKKNKISQNRQAELMESPPISP